jgi:hypothetical protein
MTAADPELVHGVKTTGERVTEAADQLAEQLGGMDPLGVRAALVYALDAALVARGEYELRQPLRDMDREHLNRTKMHFPYEYVDLERKIEGQLATRRATTDAELRAAARVLAALALPDYDRATAVLNAYVDRFAPDLVELRKMSDLTRIDRPRPLGVAGEYLLPSLERVRDKLSQPPSGAQPAGSTT